MRNRYAYICDQIKVIGKSIYISLLVCIVWGNYFAQNSRVDSLKHRVEVDNLTEEMLPILSELSKENDSTNLSYSNRGLTYAKEKGLINWQVQFLLDRARVQYANSNFPESIKDAFSAIQIIKERKLISDQEGRAHYLLALGLEQIGALEEAVKQRKEQLEWVSSNPEDSRIPEIHGFIGSLYLNMSLGDSAVVHFKKAFVFVQRFKNTQRIPGIMNDIGLSYLSIGENDSAFKYLNDSYQLFQQGTTREDSLMMGIVGGNLTLCYSSDRNEEILFLLKQDAAICNKYQDLDALGKAYMELSSYWLKQGSLESAIAYLDSADHVINQLSPIIENLELKLDLYHRYQVVLEESEDYQGALRYSRNYQELSDSLYGKEVADFLIQSRSVYLLTGIQTKLELERAELNQAQERLQLMEREEELSNLKTTLIVVIGTMLLIVAIVIILKMRSDHKKKREIQELNQKMLEASVQNKTERLTQTTLSLTRKTEFAEGLMEKLSELEGVEKKRLSPIKLFINNELQMDESLLEMEQYIADLSKDFFVKLKLAHPILTEKDIKLCGLIRLNLSIKQIAIIKNINPESVKMAKNRLGKKLGLAPGSNLYDFLKSF